MKQKTLTSILILASVLFLIGCGGDGESTTPPPPPVGGGNSGGGNGSGSPKQDMGQLPTANSDENDTNNLLNLQAIEYDDTSSELSELKICTDTACWTVLDEDNQSKTAFKNRQASKPTDRTNLINIGSYDLSEVDGEIVSIEYIYNSKKGETSLNSSVRTDQEIQKDMFLKMNENLTVPFTSISMDNGRNGIFIPDEDFKKEFVNGVIVEVDQGSANQLAHMYISSTGKTLDENLEINSYLLDFYKIGTNINDLSAIKNEFPSEFDKDIRVYIPVVIRGSDPNFIEDNYILDVNAKSIAFDVVELNSQYYFSFSSKFSSFEILVFNKKYYGGL